ncbi:hypothetical protein GKZ68_10285 [Hymenobacter sp. BRD128]|uniref:hypothetical protein n=1 Tax=Hymenobacter sp. BRD128 TaxID=2675878 RepID=UPI0015660129|nr:hypothetical protein [Hymenobacter sp. BRD128]QKG56978.1 hypothetical protein GKZ68_10285 [Hymenobacter sp. BRD128]
MEPSHITLHPNQFSKMIAITIEANGKQTEFDGTHSEIEVRKTHPDYIDLFFTAPKGEKVLISFARVLLIDPEVRDELRVAAQHTGLFNANRIGGEVRD